MRKKILCIISCICFSTCMVTDGYADDYLKIGVVAEGKYGDNVDCDYNTLKTSVSLGEYFSDRMCTPEYPNRVATEVFFYKNEHAWEQDLKPGNHYNSSGKLYPTVDDVDLVLYCGHGLVKGRNGLTNNSLHFYTCNSNTKFHGSGDVGERTNSSNLLTTEAQWGKGDAITKWVVTYTCNFLNPVDTERIKMMQGVHMVLGFSTAMYVDRLSAYDFADRLRQGEKFIDAFVGSSYQYIFPHCKKKGEKLTVSALTSLQSYNDTLFEYSGKPKSSDISNDYYQFDYKFK